jgi:phosphate transport system protein
VLRKQSRGSGSAKQAYRQISITNFTDTPSFLEDDDAGGFASHFFFFRKRFRRCRATLVAVQRRGAAESLKVEQTMFGTLLSGRRKSAAPVKTADLGAGALKGDRDIRAEGPKKMDAHTLRAFGEMLEDLNKQAAQMGAHVVHMVEGCIPIFLNHDVAAAKALIQLDLQADKQKEAIIARTVDVLALHQPVASDLRLVLAVEHIASDLERSADHAKNIAKRTLTLSASKAIDPALRDLLISLHSSVLKMLIDAMQAFNFGDAALAEDVRRRDHLPDAVYDDLFHAAIARLQANSPDVALDIQTLFVGKSLERIGDHATNIAEEASFRSRGELPSATRKP